MGGDDGTRTHDPLLAKQVLFQLSYVPEISARARNCTAAPSERDLSATLGANMCEAGRRSMGRPSQGLERAGGRILRWRPCSTTTGPVPPQESLYWLLRRRVGWCLACPLEPELAFPPIFLILLDDQRFSGLTNVVASVT